MKSWTKIVLCVMGGAFLSFGIFTLSCAKTEVKGNAATVYAETRSRIMSEETLKSVEALQNSFRAISTALLPSVVEVDTTETRTVNALYWGSLAILGIRRTETIDGKENMSRKDLALELLCVAQEM